MGTPVIKPSANIAIVWGSNDAASAGANNLPNGRLIETLTITPKNGEPIDIEDGYGFTVVQVMCKDGFNARATAVYDANKALPTEGANVTIVCPKTDGNAGTANINATYWSWGFTRTRKREKMIELFFTHRPEINT